MVSHPFECDHTSVGILAYHQDHLLLIQRKKPPYGFAPPAGHIDNHGSPLDAARTELYEEVGLRVTQLAEIASGIKANPCRRRNGTWHRWTLYKVDVPDKITFNPDEVASYIWASHTTLHQLASRSIDYLNNEISAGDWHTNPGLEIVWLEWLSQLEVIRI